MMRSFYDDDHIHGLSRQRTLDELEARRINVDVEARRIVNELDRSALGELACPDEDFVRGVQLSLLYDLHFDISEHSARSLFFSGIYNVVNDTISAEEDRLPVWDDMNGEVVVSSHQMMAEIAFWGIGTGFFEFNGFDAELFEPAFAWIKLLRAIVSTPPELHDLYKAGIWDYDIITAALASDIDSALIIRAVS